MGQAHGAGVAGGSTDADCGWSQRPSPELGSVTLEAAGQDRCGG